MMMFYAPVRALCTLTEQLESAATTAERVFEILDTQAAVSYTHLTLPTIYSV